MSLDKDDLNNTLKREQRRKGRPKKIIKYIEVEGVDEDGFKYTRTQRVEVDAEQPLSTITAQAQKTVEETYVKKATKVGKKDGEILGGIQSLGKESISPNEVIENTSVCKITDKVGGLLGTKTPKASLAGLTGLPSQVAGDTAKSGISAISAGGPSGIASTVAAGEDKKSALVSEVAAFSETIADPSELLNISASLPSVSFGSLEGTLKNISPVSEISGKIGDVKDKVANDTGIGGLTAAATGSKNKLGFFSSAKSVVSSVLTDVSSAVKDFSSSAGKFVEEQTSRFDKGLQSGFLQNIGESISGTSSAFIANIVTGGVSLNDDEYKETFARLTARDEVEKTKAVKSLTQKSQNVSGRMKNIINNTSATTSNDLQSKVIEAARQQGIPETEITEATNEISTIDTAASKLDTTIGGTLVVDAKLFDDAPPISDNNQKWSGRTSSDDVFTYVSSVEELDTEFAKISREVTEIVVHATDTYTNKNIGAIEINNIHNELGHDGIGYHYVIRRDGRLQRGRPVNRQGDHAPVNGHDKYSIGIVMVGGLDTPAGDDVFNRSAHTFTRAQFTTLEQFIGAFYRQYPGGQVFGHSDIDINEFDPYFDVIDYIESIFRKKNKTTEPLNKGPLSPVEIIKGAVYVTKASLLQEREDVAFELGNAEDVRIEEIDEERQSNTFVRPPKPEGFPQTRADGVVVDYEWDEGGNEWVESEDWSNYDEGESPNTTTVVFTNA